MSRFSLLPTNTRTQKTKENKWKKTKQLHFICVTVTICQLAASEFANRSCLSWFYFVCFSSENGLINYVTEEMPTNHTYVSFLANSLCPQDDLWLEQKWKLSACKFSFGNSIIINDVSIRPFDFHEIQRISVTTAYETNRSRRKCSLTPMRTTATLNCRYADADAPHGVDADDRWNRRYKRQNCTRKSHTNDWCFYAFLWSLQARRHNPIDERYFGCHAMIYAIWTSRRNHITLKRLECR